ncbi:MAG TPA: hypothetical protein VER33_28815 [Polyangiaceae bacterium]|nr:hypothetical protein [Polyangiaceae bacterium]
MLSTASRRAAALILVTVALAGCESPPAKKDDAARPSEAVDAPAPAATKASGPVELVIEDSGPRVGYVHLNLQIPEGPRRLQEELASHRSELDGKELRLAVGRKAKPQWVSLYIEELAKVGAASVTIKTDTRRELRDELGFTAQSKARSAAACSPVAMILEDRATAVWKLSGGVAGRRPRGMAGPDLAMTGDSIERVAKACKAGASLFVAAASGIEWGLLYDLAASARALQDVRFEHVVLLGEIPVPGHKVGL